MINLDDAQFKITLKEASMDKKNNEYMVESNKKVVDFDQVKSFYVKDIKPVEVPSSNDVYIDIGDEFYFIEFKNGNIRNERHKIVRKIYDSLLIFSDITGKTISFIRENGNYILVYNYEKNKEFVKQKIQERQEPNNKKLDKSEIQESEYFDDITMKFGKLGDYPIDILALEPRFGKICFKTVKTYDINQFEDKFISKYC